jgi:Leucine-rich repeat (LRR) protein
MYNFKRDWRKRQYTDWLNSGGLPDYNVETLHLNNDNDITNLSDNINNLPNLKEINLSRTPITQLPSSIGQLNNLEELYLQHSGIESLPEELKNITRPIKIVAYGTPLSRNPNSGLQNWPPNFYIYLRSALDQTMLSSIQQLQQMYPNNQEQIRKTSVQINRDTIPYYDTKYSFLNKLNKRHSDIFEGKGGRKRRTNKRRTNKRRTRRVSRTKRR